MKKLLYLLAALHTAALPSIVVAQAQATSHVIGTVKDPDGKPLMGAVVTISSGNSESTQRTDETGSFMFRDVRVGNYAVEVRRLGFERYRQGVDVVVRMANLAITLTRSPQLDTVKVKASVQAIYGAVGTVKDLRPVATATVQVIGMSQRYPVDSNARFFIPVKNSGAYMVRVSADGFDPQVISVTVPKNQGVELAPLLDAASGPKSLNYEAALDAFTERARNRNPQRSALLSHTDLMEDGNIKLVEATRGSAPFLKRSLHFSDQVCLFVDGTPRPNVSLSAYDPREIEAMEVYSYERSGNMSSPTVELTKKWPKGQMCGDSGMPRVSNAPGLSENTVQYIVIWLRK